MIRRAILNVRFKVNWQKWEPEEGASRWEYETDLPEVRFMAESDLRLYWFFERQIYNRLTLTNQLRKTLM